ncbi:MAG: hypothetical protein AAGN46_03210 [Acidobacteriota bacterium]
MSRPVPQLSFRSFWRAWAAAPVGLLLLAALAPATATAQSCDRVHYRLWKDGNERWFEHGETVEIVSGTSADLYIHVDRGSRVPASTGALVAYPKALGFSGTRSLDVVKHVRMREQTAQDRSQGKISFRADQVGSTRIAYRIERINGGQVTELPGACRTDQIEMRVVSSAAALSGRRGSGVTQRRPGASLDDDIVGRQRPDRSRRGGRYDDDDRSRYSRGDRVAFVLVEDLYVGLLRRDEPGTVHLPYVDHVLEVGRSGLEDVAGELLKSTEFHREAIPRTPWAARSSGAEADRLLEAIYSDLYGPDRPSGKDWRADLRDLEACLDGRDRACEVLGRNLVDTRLYEERNERELDLLDRVDRRR